MDIYAEMPLEPNLKGLISAYVSSLSLVTTHFIVSRELSEAETRKVIRKWYNACEFI